MVDEGGWTGAVTGYVAEESSSVVGESGHGLKCFMTMLVLYYPYRGKSVGQTDIVDRVMERRELR